jgi:hypothetical protein
VIGRVARHVAVLAAALGSASPARARTWIEDARDELLCVRLASPAERAALVTEIPTDASVRGWVTQLAGGPADRWVRYQLGLGALASFADQTDDQRLRQGLLIEIGVLAQRDGFASPALRAQLGRCAISQLVEAELEGGDTARLRETARLLASRYGGPPEAGGAEDLPLVEALRTAALANDRATSEPLLQAAGRRAAALAGPAPLRASRLYAAMAAADESIGDVARAASDAGHSDGLTGPVGADVWRAWQNFPVRFELAKRRGRLDQAARIADAFEKAFPLPAAPDPRAGAPADPALEVAVRLRLAELAFARGEPDRAAGLLQLARRTMGDTREGRIPIAAFRPDLQAIEQLVRRLTATSLAWGADPALAARALDATYRPLVQRMMAVRNTVPLGAERMCRLYQEQIDERLDELAHLARVLPAARAEIADIAFRLFQLRAFDQAARAVAFRYLAAKPLEPKFRQDVERILNYQISPSLGFRNLWIGLHAHPASAPEQAQAVRQALLTLDVYDNEIGRGGEEFIRQVFRGNPQLGLLLTATPWHLESYQKLLHPGEGMLVSEPTPVGTLTWGIRPDAAWFARADADEAAIGDRVRRLRASLTPSEAPACLEVPPFEAGLAHELYRDTLGPFERWFAPGTHVFWYGGGSLAAVPPALLVRRPPPRDRVASASELRALAWADDLFAFSVLPDPAMLIVDRATVPLPASRRFRFLGVGAPGPTLEQRRGLARRPIDDENPARGLGLLRSLATRPVTGDELADLAQLFPRDGVRLLLNEQADKPAVLRELAQGADVVAFSTHGFLAGDVPGVFDPSLMLHVPAGAASPLEAVLTAHDLGSQAAGAGLVILSACNTAGPDGRPEAGAFSGLATSFMRAGAQALMVSHWEVASGAASALTTATVRAARAGGAGLASGLRAAMRALRNQPAPACDALHAHPYYWAPFVLVGDGARGLP